MRQSGVQIASGQFLGANFKQEGRGGFEHRQVSNSRGNRSGFCGFYRQPGEFLLLAFFIAGAALGILAVTPTVFRQRRERTRAEDKIQALQNVANSASTAPLPDSVNPNVPR